MIGWIKIERAITEHWIYSDPIKFRWWITILINVNYKDSKFILGNKLYDLPKGSSVNSLRTWASILNTGVKSVNSFFTLLENDAMISKKILGKGKQSTTLINITNYGKYQIGEETLKGTLKGTQGGTLRKHEGRTEEECIESKESKELLFERFWNQYNKKVGDKTKCLKSFLKLSDLDIKKIFETLPTFLAKITDKQYQPFPQTYLNNKRWNDEIGETKPIENDFESRLQERAAKEYEERMKLLKEKGLLA
jgi:hypothetical protein